MSRGYFGRRSALTLDALFSGLVDANHILHYHAVLDAYGHISVRNPDNHDTFFMAHNAPPALASCADDFVEFKVEDGSPADAKLEIAFSERYIHSEIYKRFPAVNSVIHSHTEDVLPYGATGVPLKPIIHMAGFLGNEVPVWDISSAYSSSNPHDLLVRSPQLGASLATAFTKSETSAGFIYSKLSSSITGSHPEAKTEPDHPVVLMRGHGMSIAAQGIEEAVYMAIYTKQAAKAQTTALTIKNAFFDSKLEGKVQVDSGGKIKDGTIKSGQEMHYLNAKETTDSAETMSKSVQRPWRLWVREVERNPLYDNDVKGEIKRTE